MRAFLHALVMPRSNAMLRDALPWEQISSNCAYFVVPLISIMKEKVINVKLWWLPTLYISYFSDLVFYLFFPLFDKPWFALSVFFKDIGENQIELFRANL